MSLLRDSFKTRKYPEPALLYQHFSERKTSSRFEVLIGLDIRLIVIGRRQTAHLRSQFTSYPMAFYTLDVAKKAYFGQPLPCGVRRNIQVSEEFVRADLVARFFGVDVIHLALQIERPTTNHTSSRCFHGIKSIASPVFIVARSA